MIFTHIVCIFVFCENVELWCTQEKTHFYLPFLCSLSTLQYTFSLWTHHQLSRRSCIFISRQCLLEKCLNVLFSSPSCAVCLSFQLAVCVCVCEQRVCVMFIRLPKVFIDGDYYYQVQFFFYDNHDYYDYSFYYYFCCYSGQR